MDSAQNTSEFTALKELITKNQLPVDLAEKLLNQITRLEKMGQSGGRVELERDLEYLKFVVNLPFHQASQDILDLPRTSQILEKNHYGLKIVKDRVLEYLSVLILNHKKGQKLHSPILAFVGLVGTGKTSLAYSIAEALGRQMVRIPFGGLGSVAQLRGQSRVIPEAEPGQIMKALSQIKINNPVILLDEIDRVSQEGKADVMGVLVELLDPAQNNAFLDHYVDYPFDLSQALFIATANNTGNIATAVMDRLEIIEMPSYTDEEKIMIGRNYILPKALNEAGIDKNLILIDDNMWPQIVRPLGFDGGIRSLQRNIQALVRKVARKVVEGNPGPYKIGQESLGEFLS